MNELIQIGPISPLRQRLIDDMTMRRFSKETQRNYLRDVGRFASLLERSPHTASAEDVRQFQIEQRQAGVPAPTMNSIVSALRFFFTHTLDGPDLARRIGPASLEIIGPRTPRAIAALSPLPTCPLYPDATLPARRMNRTDHAFRNP